MTFCSCLGPLFHVCSLLFMCRISHWRGDQGAAAGIIRVGSSHMAGDLWRAGEGRKWEDMGPPTDPGQLALAGKTSCGQRNRLHYTDRTPGSWGRPDTPPLHMEWTILPVGTTVPRYSKPTRTVCVWEIGLGRHSTGHTPCPWCMYPQGYAYGGLRNPALKYFLLEGIKPLSRFYCCLSTLYRFTLSFCPGDYFYIQLKFTIIFGMNFSIVTSLLFLFCLFKKKYLGYDLNHHKKMTIF